MEYASKPSEYAQLLVPTAFTAQTRARYLPALGTRTVALVPVDTVATSVAFDHAWGVVPIHKGPTEDRSC